MKFLFALSLFLLSCSCLTAQGTIRLDNPSFESKPQHSITPIGWDNCGFEEESPPDAQSSGDFGVTQKPFHGESYLAMVVRDNVTWECVGQELDLPMLKDSCYL